MLTPLERFERLAAPPPLPVDIVILIRDRHPDWVTHGCRRHDSLQAFVDPLAQDREVVFLKFLGGGVVHVSDECEESSSLLGNVAIPVNLIEFFQRDVREPDLPVESLNFLELT